MVQIKHDRAATTILLKKYFLPGMYTALLSVFLFLSANMLPAQIHNIRFGNLTTDHGLSLNDVKNTFQDSQGFIWFCTRDGLNKFDGDKFIVYKNNPLDSQSISSNDVRGMCEDSNGYLWVATFGGLNRFDRNKQTFKRYTAHSNKKNAPASNRLLFIALSKENNLVLGHVDGLIVFNTATEIFSNYSFKNAEGDDMRFASFLPDNKEQVWMGSFSDGLKCFDLKTRAFVEFTNDPLSRRLLGYRIGALCHDKQGNIWIGASGNGIFYFNTQSRKFIHYNRDPFDATKPWTKVIFAIREDRKENLWIGTQNQGMYFWNKNKNEFTHWGFSESGVNGLPDNSVQSMFEDKQGTMWFGTNNGGVCFYNEQLAKFQNYTHLDNKNSLSHNVVKGFCEDRNGKIWITTEGGGLNMFDPVTGKFKVYKHNAKDAKTVSTNFLLPVYEDKNGDIWIGSYKGGLNLLNQKTGTFWVYKPDQKNKTTWTNDVVMCIYEDKEDNFWLGTRLGLLLFNRKTRTHISYQNPFIKSVAENPICLLEDSKGLFWVGDRQGLYLFNKKTGSFSQLPRLSDSILTKARVRVILEDSRSNLWIGTDDGLYNLNRNDFSIKRTGVENGLPDAYINGLLEDEKQNLWIMGNRGLSRLNTATGKLENFDITDGVKSFEFRRDACLKTRSGKMYIGGINGFNVFHPDSIKSNSFIPPVYIVDFQLFNKSVPIGGQASPLQNDISVTKELVLSYKQSVFSFEFIALNYIEPKKNQYAYKLERFDEDWNYSGNQHKATYTNLDAGEYVFRVRASNNDGVWNEAGTSIKVIITPPFWETWWFRMAVIIFLLGCFVVFYNVRINMVKKQQRILEEEVKKRTSEIEEKNQKILVQNKQLIQQHEELETQKKELADQHISLERLVTERTIALTETNKELILSKQQLQDMMDNSPAVIYIKDLDGKYLFINRQYEKLFRISREEIKGKTVKDLFPPHVVELAGKHDEAVMKTGRALSFEESGMMNGVMLTYVSVRFPLYDAYGKMYAVGGISTDISDRKQAEEALRQLSAHLQEVREEERISIAREIHDELGQQLTGIKMDVAWISKKVDIHEKDLNQKLSGMVSLIDEMIKSVRRISTQLRPSILDDLGLIAAMDWHSEEFEKRSGIETSFKTDIHELSISPNAATGLFRIYQESLTNVARHAEATKVSTILQIHNSELILKISDNGKGFETNKISGKKTLGLLGMKERTLMMGGRYEIISEPGKGATVCVSVPL